MKLTTFKWHLVTVKEGVKKFFTCRRLSNEIYHAGGALSSTVIKDMSNKSANYIYHKHIKKDLPDNRTPAFVLGSATHKYILEKKSFYDEFAVWEGGRRSGAEYKQFKEDNQDKEILTLSEFQEIQSYRKAVFKHPLAKGLLTNGQPEHSVVWVDPKTGIKMKARADYLTNNNVVIDLKTCTDISDEGLIKSIYNYGYYVQAHHYLTGFDGAAFVFIFVLKGANPEVKVVHLGVKFIEMGAFVWERNVQKYAEMMNDFGVKKEWFGYEQNALVELDAEQWHEYRILGS